MALPIRDVVWPAALAGQSNGRLAADRLVSVPGQAQGATVTLVAVASRSWLALCAAAKAAGFILKATGGGDSYRSYAAQESLFRSRYATSNTGRESKVWGGVRYWLRAGMASAAVPGTSNHGLGIAVDIAVELDGDPGPESITTQAVDWLVAHAHEYGWSAELQSEPWHWRYVDGDTIPTAVTKFEQGETEMMIVFRNASTGGVYVKDGPLVWGLADNDAVKEALSLAGQTEYRNVAANRVPAYGVDIVALVRELVTTVKAIPGGTGGTVTAAQIRQALDGATVTSKLDTTP